MKVLEYLSESSVKGAHCNFLKQFQQTMDFIGFGPINEGDISVPLSIEEILVAFFRKQDGLTKFLPSDSTLDGIKGFLIEVKSRTKANYWKPFQYSFSDNQEEMFTKVKNFNFEILLCGVTFGKNWELAVVFTDFKGKILPHDFLKEYQ